MGSWTWMRRWVDLVSVLVIVALIVSAGVQWKRGSKQAGRLLPGLVGAIVGGTILVFNNWGFVPGSLYTPARWIGVAILLLAAIALCRK